MKTGEIWILKDKDNLSFGWTANEIKLIAYTTANEIKLIAYKTEYDAYLAECPLSKSKFNRICIPRNDILKYYKLKE